MISFDLNFFPREDAHESEYGQFDERVDTFVSCLGRHGNIVGDAVSLDLEDRLQVRVCCLAPDALEEANQSEHAREFWGQVREMSVKAPEIQELVETKREQTWCDCQTPSFRLLYTHRNRLVSPVRCGDCWGDVPLYRLPLLDDASMEHGQLTTWLDNRENFEWTWLHSREGEREAYRQLSRPRSPFMKYTRELSAELEAKTGVPTFSFLKHYYEKWGKKCPLCERKWKWKGPKKLRYRCDHCRLLSEKPFYDRTPLSQLHP